MMDKRQACNWLKDRRSILVSKINKGKKDGNVFVTDVLEKEALDTAIINLSKIEKPEDLVAQKITLLDKNGVLLSEFEAPAIHKVKEICTWNLNGHFWKTDCGHEINDNDTSFSWQFCPWCARFIKDADKLD